jgi:segregation and condensation protein A
MAELDDTLDGKSGEGGVIVDEATNEALRLHLDQFEGPFEVLLYLIKVQEIDIFDIPIVKITEQYLQFLELLREEDLDVTSEFLVLAATLIQIKAKMLVPPSHDAEEEPIEEDEDPRLELVEKLIEYRKYREMTSLFGKLEDARNNWYTRHAKPKFDSPAEDEEDLLEVTLYDLMKAFRGVLRYFNDDIFHTVTMEGASVDEKIVSIEEALEREGSLAWTDLFKSCRNRVEVVCCFLAILEMCRMGKLRAYQSATYEDIRLFPPSKEQPAQTPAPA